MRGPLLFHSAMAIVLITGGSGLIGSALSRALLNQGHEVRWLSRSPRQQGSIKVFSWDPQRGLIDPEALRDVHSIVHLAGAGIADKRWNDSRVKDLIASRAGTSHLLRDECMRQGIRPSAFISAAGVGYYGAVTTAHRFKEDEPPGKDTIARISAEWEEAVDQWGALCRVVKIRTPIVLSATGGALPRLARVARWGVASPIGTGRQRMPWVHIDDLLEAYMQAIGRHDMSGAYNIAASDSSNAEFMRTLAKVLRRPYFLPSVPAVLIRMVFGELGALLLEGSGVDDGRLRSTGFRYRYSELGGALRSLLVKD